ncbi:flagellar basal body-associated FliL family protein [Clostridium septicum]|uniref:Flagellar protein FliL n=1 Tax=Clostridium septicum TaxID=1504 RepID=A0A9N7PI78_CLOSE|nr:flagellar basal body-associated FliL family protein [Clostridium septicum]AYE33420.1 flagellar basal body-associated protein FliL [Clostridium septicum]MDU1313970.1 flagellar basal body-associated FliL family protein [Clostridium septicum]QAS61594.1 flagellar basal body-associated FliL family protein [Clostridium septicum]UEC21969.1 flagellar basal body-associated FliL family protein [Clostridium septicum]USR99999.1 flagellar basal body-associated FliL family protein [Clostridium septicum]
MAIEKDKDGNKGKKIIVIILALVVVGAATFAAVYFAESKKVSAGEVVIEESYNDLGEVFINLSDEGGRRYAKLSASIGYDKSNEELGKEIEDKKVAIRDTAIYYFKSCKAKDFNAESETNLKGELVKRINQKLRTGAIRDVYIKDIVIQ